MLGKYIINKSMDNKMQKSNFEETQSSQTEKKPDENSGIHVEGFIKIFDPETQEVLVKGRA